MLSSTGKGVIVLTVLLLVFPLVTTAAAPISTIASGNTVFVGEQGLDITAALAGDTRLGWWASGASISTASPDKKMSVSNPAGFFISPAEFSSYLGTWYHLGADGKANGVAFIVADPRLDLRVEDTTVDVDVTDKWVPTDDEIQFRIETNLYQITQRGVSPPITISVQSPDGATFSSLINKAGTTTSLVDIPVSYSPYFTGPIWDTGRRDNYPTGTYKIWAECNVNSMKDNYGESGKTISGRSSLLDQEQNPLIRGTTRTTTLTTAATKTAAPITTLVSAVQNMTATTIPTTQPVTTTSSLLPEPTTSLTSQSTVPGTQTSTKAPGFESVIAGAALFIAIAWFAQRD